jgi:hypothetical protein
MHTCELHVQILTLDITVRCPSKEEEPDERGRQVVVALKETWRDN